MISRYDHLNKEELLRLLEAREQRDATRFGLVWEANEIDRDKALNNDFVALDLVQNPNLVFRRIPIAFRYWPKIINQTV